MGQHYFIPMLGKRLRVTELSKSGTILNRSRKIVTEGFITLSLSSQVEDGTEIIQRNAAGNLCVNEKRPNSFKRFDAEMEFCGVNPQLLTFTTNAEAYRDHAGDIAGFTVPEGAIDKKFALELWTGLSGVDNAGAGEDDEASGYLLLALVDAGVLGDISVDGENAITFSMTGAATKGGNTWGTGPYRVVNDDGGLPSALPTALDPFDHLLLIDTSLAPPPVAGDAANVKPYTGVTAGSPGAFLPAGIGAPSSLTALQNEPDVGDDGDDSPTTAWAAGQYVVLDNGTEAYWNNTTDAWVSGRAPVPPLTGVTAGAPGAFQPGTAAVPLTLTALKADGTVGDAGTNKPTTAWTTGQYVNLGDNSKANWSGTAWVAGTHA